MTHRFRWSFSSVCIGICSMLMTPASAQLTSGAKSESATQEDTTAGDPHLARSRIWRQVFGARYDPLSSTLLLTPTKDPERWDVIVADRESAQVSKGAFAANKRFPMPVETDSQTDGSEPLPNREVVAGQLFGPTGEQLFVFGELLTTTTAVDSYSATLVLYGTADSLEDTIAYAEKHYATATFAPSAPPEIPPNCPYPDCLELCTEDFLVDQIICGSAWANCRQTADSHLRSCASFCARFPIPNYATCFGACVALYGTEVVACDVARQLCLIQAGRDNLRCIRNCRPREP